MKREPVQVVDNSPPIEPTPVVIVQDVPVVVGTAENYAIEVIVKRDKTRESEDIRWVLALLTAIVGGFFIYVGIGSETIYHQIFWAILLLTLVVAIKR